MVELHVGESYVGEHVYGLAKCQICAHKFGNVPNLYAQFLHFARFVRVPLLNNYNLPSSDQMPLLPKIGENLTVDLLFLTIAKN